MKKLLTRNKTHEAEGPPDGAAAPQERPEGGLPANPQTTDSTTPAPKPPPELPLFFMVSHLADDGPVRLDGVKLGVCEVMGLELDEPKLGAFAGALNACDFPVQLLIRQHPPRLGGLRDKLTEAQPGNLPPQTKAASESLRSVSSSNWRRGTASSTGASTPCASSLASTSCGACWHGPGCPSTPSAAGGCGC